MNRLVVKEEGCLFGMLQSGWNAIQSAGSSAVNGVTNMARGAVQTGEQDAASVMSSAASAANNLYHAGAAAFTQVGQVASQAVQGVSNTAHQAEQLGSALLHGGTPQASPPASHGTAQHQEFTAPKTGQWTQGSNNQPADPVTIDVHGSLSQLEDTLTDQGWTKADPNTPASAANVAVATAKNLWNQLTNSGAPADQAVNKEAVSPQTLDGQPSVAAFERNNDPLAGRDHLRIFDTGQTGADGKPVYAISASQDTGLAVQVNPNPSPLLSASLSMISPLLAPLSALAPTHAVNSNVDTERDNVVQSLQKGGANVQQVHSLQWSGTSSYGETVPDGKAYELSLPTTPH